jgi:adenylosuccinate synthase
MALHNFYDERRCANAFDEIKICTHYKMKDGTTTDALPFDLTMRISHLSLSKLEGMEKQHYKLTEFNSVTPGNEGIH